MVFGLVLSKSSFCAEKAYGPFPSLSDHKTKPAIEQPLQYVNGCVNENGFMLSKNDICICPLYVQWLHRVSYTNRETNAQFFSWYWPIRNFQNILDKWKF